MASNKPGRFKLNVDLSKKNLSDVVCFLLKIQHVEQTTDTQCIACVVTRMTDMAKKKHKIKSFKTDTFL